MTTMNQNQQLLHILSSLQTTGSITDTAKAMYLTQTSASNSSDLKMSLAFGWWIGVPIPCR